MNYLTITYPDINNGPGFRATLWIAGCSHKCHGCHNKHTWDYSLGKKMNSIEFNKEIDDIFKNEYITGLTISGGDPLDQSENDLKELYVAMSDLIRAEDEDKAVAMEGEAEEAKRDAPRKRHKFKELLNAAMPTDVLPDSEETEDEPELLSVEESVKERMTPDETPTNDGGPETVEQVKKGLKDYLKSMFRRI